MQDAPAKRWPSLADARHDTPGIETPIDRILGHRSRAGAHARHAARRGRRIYPWSDRARVPTLADRLWPVQKAIAISSGRFCMLVNRDDDHLNMLAVSQAGDTRQSRTCRPRKRMWSGLLPVTIDRLPLSPGSRRCHSVLVPSFGHRIGESALVLGCEHLGMKRRRCSGHYGGSGHQPADNPAEFVESDPMPTPLRGGRLSSAKEPHEKPLRV